MSRKASYDISFAKGLNDALASSELEPGEVQSTLNFDYSSVPNGATRNGYSKYNQSKFQDSGSNDLQITGLTSFAYSPGAYRDVLSAFSNSLDSFWRVSGSTATVVAFASSITAGTNGYPFTFANIGNRIIGTNGDTTNFIWDGNTGNSCHALGIAAPGSGTATAEGGASNPNGVYRYKVSFYDSTLDVHSALSAATTARTVASKQIDLSSIPTSTNTRVTQRKIWRTRGTGQAPYRLVTTITDNSTTTFSDTITDSALGVEAPDAGQPADCRFCLEHNGVLWLANNPSGQNYSRVYFSEPGRPEEFDQESGFLDLDAGDGSQITGMFVIANQLIVMKETKIWHITGTNKKNYALSTIARKGMKWAYAGDLFQNTLIFGSDDGPYIYDANNPQKITDDRAIFQAQGTWDDIGNLEGSSLSNFGEEVRAVFIPELRQIWMTYRTSANSGPNDRILVWNYGSVGRPWSIYDFGFDAHGFWRANYSNKRTLVFGSESMDGFVFKANSGNTDAVDSTGTLSGTATAGDATSLTDSTASFDTTGDGLEGVIVTVWDNSNSDTTQQVRITSNTATKLTVASWTGFTPASPDTYAIGAIKNTVKTGKMSFGNKATNKAPLLLHTKIEAT